MSHHYIKFRDVHYKYPNGYEALRGIDFLITHGEKVAFVGLNGAGKSTLLLQINGLLLPTEGEVEIGGIPVCRQTLGQIRQSVGMVFQNADDQLFMSTVEEDVAFGPLNMNLPEEEVEKRVECALKAVGCFDLRGRHPDQLSGGQKRRVAIATVLSMEPSILVLDEPSSNLDWKSRREMIDIIGEFQHTVVIATHDLGLIRELCQRTIVIDEGRVIGDAPTEIILKDRNITDLLGIT